MDKQEKAQQRKQKQKEKKKKCKMEALLRAPVNNPKRKQAKKINNIDDSGNDNKRTENYKQLREEISIRIKKKKNHLPRLFDKLLTLLEYEKNIPIVEKYVQMYLTGGFIIADIEAKLRHNRPKKPKRKSKSVWTVRKR